MPCLAELMVVVDITIVNVTLASIQDDLGLSVASRPPSSRSDRNCRRNVRVFLAANAFFGGPIRPEVDQWFSPETQAVMQALASKLGKRG